ncbi:MAG: solute carrier family 23 protein [Acholeplasmataceae bacterium]
MQEKEKSVGYLPNEKPSLLKSLTFALQQFLVMLPATVLAAIIMNLNGVVIYSIPAAIFASGFATICFLLITRMRIPLYYGSSFSYIPAVSIVVTYATLNHITDNIAILGTIIIASIISGLMSITAGILIKYYGKDKIDKILPGHITGMIAMIIGLALAGNTISNILMLQSDPVSGNLINTSVDWLSVLIAMVTFLSVTIITVVLRKGFISQLPILLGLGIGIIFSYLLWVPFSANAGGYQTYFEALKTASTIKILDVMPWNTIPAAFTQPALIGVAVLAIFPIAFATIPESAAHVNQIDLYVNELAEQKNSNTHYNIKDELDNNLIGDGVGDIVAVVLGGPAGTNYGENISASAITKNFSSYVFMITGILAVLVGLLLEILNIGDLSLIVTKPVVQGVSLYLFGAIAVQGIALMIEKKVNVFDPKVIAVMAFIGIVGLGTSSIYITETFILPGIGVAAFGGILLNLLFNLLEKVFVKNKKS